ncbi:MAG: hypothetical protein Q4G42_04030 [Neisseria sp.]|nr:hypothetical protein [Neisseria sp.]
MREYPRNSPQAGARIVAMCMLADSDLDPSELGASELEKIYQVLGMRQAEFLSVLRDYLHDLRRVTANPAGRISMLEPERVNAILDAVDEHAFRINVLALSLAICKGDHALNEAEIALFRHIMARWQIDLTDLEIEVSLG